MFPCKPVTNQLKAVGPTASLTTDIQVDHGSMAAAAMLLAIYYPLDYLFQKKWREDVCSNQLHEYIMKE